MRVDIFFLKKGIEFTSRKAKEPLKGIEYQKNEEDKDEKSVVLRIWIV